MADSPDSTRLSEDEKRARRLAGYAAYYLANKERLRAKNREWRAANPDKVKASEKARRERDGAKLSAYAAAWRARNPDKVKAQRLSYYAKNSHRVAAWNTAWSNRNPDNVVLCQKNYRERHYEQLRAKRLAAPETEAQARRRRERRNARYHQDPSYQIAFNNRRRARKAGIPGQYTPKDVRALAVRQRHKCAYCRASIRSGFHVDHHVPLALGGSNAASNIQLLCAKCNLKKGCKHPVDYARQIGLLI